MKIIKIDTNNNMEIIELISEGNIDNQIRKELNGWIEIVKPKRLDERFIMIVDEEGLLKDLDINIFGSYLYETDIHSYPIVGDIFIVKLKHSFDGVDITGLDNDDIEFFKNKYETIIKNLQ